MLFIDSPIKRKIKYGNIKTKMFGLTFASKHELNFYLYLLTIYTKEDIELQPKFLLQDKFKQDGKFIKPIHDIADFRVGTNVYDVKGHPTETFKIKAKLFKTKYPQLKLVAVRWKSKQWIEE